MTLEKVTPIKRGKKVFNCATCGLSQNKFKSEINPNTEILFVRDFPSEFEIRSKNYFSTTDSKFLKLNILKAGIDLDKCGFTYSILCNIPKPPRNIPIDSIKSCGINLLSKISELKNLKLVVTCGEYGFKLFSNKSQLKKYRGELYKKDSLPIFSTYDPKYILSNKQEETTFINDLIKVKKIINNEISVGKDIDFLLCKTIDDLEYAKQKLNESEYYAFDIETIGGEFGLDPFSLNNKIMTIGFTTDKLESFCIPIDHPELKKETIKNKLSSLIGLPVNDNTCNMIKDKLIATEDDMLIHYIYIISFLRDVLFNNSKRVAHNARFDVKCISKLLDLPVINVYFDTMLASSVLNKGNGNSNSLKRLSVELLGYAESYSVIEDGIKNDKIKLYDLAKYNCEDTYNTVVIYKILLEKLEKEELSDLFFNIVMKGNEVLTDIELNGAKIDIAYGEKLLLKYEENKKALLDKLLSYEEIKKIPEFNINSSDHLGKLLYDIFKLKCPKLTDTGKRSTDVESLNKLNGHQFVADLLIYKKYEKCIGTYVTPLIQDHIKKDGKIHCNYNQAVTATGRLSSSLPNLQNVPARGELGKEIKKMFVASEQDWVILQADYSQIELRVAAICANEPTMLQAYIDDKDIHKITPASIFNKKVEDVTKEERQAGKSLNFGLIYGMSARGLVMYSKKGYGVDMSEEQAEQYRNRYFKLYSTLPKWYDKIKKEASSTGNVKNLFGRKRIIENINSPNKYLRGEAERKCYNSPVQSSASDMLILSLYNINKYLKEKSIRARIINTVHDSIVLECHKDDLIKTAKIVKTIMENIPTPFEKLCPIKAELEYGPNWGELKELKI